LNQNQVIIIIATYNERNNVQALAENILDRYPQIELLFIDDNSPDETGKILDELSTNDSRIHVIHREEKLGLGTAYIKGFKWALARDYEYIFEMDADFSHRPEYIADFLKAVEDADLVLGSRYTCGVNVINWSLTRILISLAGTLYVRLLTALPITDATGGFKCFRRYVLERLDLEHIKSNGYAFQIEVTYKAWLAGFKIREIPIIFYDRVIGTSKMNKKIIYEAILIVPRLVLSNLFKKKPQRIHFYQPEK
jgi:dolichol-phosphate mannosyltransferase